MITTAIQSSPNRNASNIHNAYEQLINLLQTGGLHPQLQCLNNEAPNDLKQYLTQQDLAYKLIPPTCTAL